MINYVLSLTQMTLNSAKLLGDARKMAKKTVVGQDGKQYEVKTKKPFYKRVWFWIVVVVLLIIVVASAGGSDDSSSSSSSSDSSTSTKPTTKKNTAVAKTLNAGTFKVGTDIKPGRYVVKATSGSGNFTNDSGDINAILGTTVDNTLGQVDSYTVDLKKNDNIKLSGIESADFTPTPSKRTFKTDLTAGNWEVGKDIKAGRYVITATQGSGNLTTDDGDVNEILGTTKDSSTGQVTKVTVNLHNGQVLENSIEGIKLTAK